MTRHIEPLIHNKENCILSNNSYHFDTTKHKPESDIDKKEIESRLNSYKAEKINWENTLEKCIKSIVSIKGYRARGLDTETPGVFTATGFIVDAERGIILSNRHVVSVSPVSAQAILCNYEVIDLIPVYRDPVHDFGFFRYDPSKIRFLNIPGIQLYPQGAKIGQEIRVVGNDAGEKLSILSGTLARLDRDVPNYGIGEYNDFNTFYYQAASSTSSGSSGSPVLDLYGRAIALNAGGASTSSSSYYLPLNRALRVLEYIQENKPVFRGDLQATFEYVPYDSLLQLGLSHQLEKKLRAFYDKSSDNSSNEGLLVVKSVLPDGPASCYLESGDILLSCNGNLLLNLFVDLEEYFDRALETKTPVHLTFLRSGKLKEFAINVGDLQSVTPFRYLEFGGGVLNDLSYQIARSFGLSLNEGGVYVGAAGFMLGNARVLRNSIIIGANNKQVKTIDDFVKAVSDTDQGGYVPIRYYSLSRPMKTKVTVLHLDWRFHKFQMAIRNDKTGYWDYKLLPTSLDKHFGFKKSTPMVALNENNNAIKDPIQNLLHSIVSIDCSPPFVVDGSKNAHSYGAGVIVSLDPPLILCDRDTVPIGISVISITFQNSLTIPADLLFLHPFYNFSVLKFDASLVINAGMEIGVATLDKEELNVGDTVNYIGLSGSSEIDIKTTTITSLTPIRTTETSPARWRATHVEVFKVSGGTLSSQGGIFSDDNGKIRAIWMSFSIDTEKNQLSSVLGGISSHLILPVIDSIKLYGEATVYGLDAEFWGLKMSNARLLGLNEDWVSRFKKESGENKQPSVLYVLGITDPSTESGKILRNGDMVLEINEKIPTRISDLSSLQISGILSMIILRDGKELNLNIPTTEYNGKETTEVVGWQGTIVQESHSAAKEQVQKNVPEGVYVSSCLLGSPAQACLKSSVWITEINQTPVKNLRDFISVITSKKKNIYKNSTIQVKGLNLKDDPMSTMQDEEVDIDINTHIQVKYVTVDNITHVNALRLDKHYWPTWHVTRDNTHVYGWKYTSFD